MNLYDIVNDLIEAKRLLRIYPDDKSKRSAYSYCRLRAEEKLVELTNALYQAASNSFSWDNYQTDRDTAKNNDRAVMVAIQELGRVIFLVINGDL